MRERETEILLNERIYLCDLWWLTTINQSYGKYREIKNEIVYEFVCQFVSNSNLYWAELRVHGHRNHHRSACDWNHRSFVRTLAKSKMTSNSIYYFLSSICGRRTTTGNGCALIFVYMTYTMLPVRLREALVGGLLLSGVHIYFSINNATAFNWPEVRCTKKTLFIHSFTFNSRSVCWHDTVSIWQTSNNKLIKVHFIIFLFQFEFALWRSNPHRYCVQSWRC